MLVAPAMMRISNSRNSYLAGDYSNAVEKLPASKKKDAIYSLVMGRIEQQRGNIVNSTLNYNRAETFCDAQEAAAEIQLGKEAKSLLTSEAFTEYKFMPTDSIMLSTYQALNSWNSAPDSTRVHITRAFERQKMFLFYNQKELEDIEVAANTNANFTAIKASGTYDNIINEQTLWTVLPLKSLDNPLHFTSMLFHQSVGR